MAKKFADLEKRNMKFVIQIKQIHKNKFFLKLTKNAWGGPREGKRQSH